MPRTRLKIGKPEAGYQEHPKATQRCGSCSMYQQGGACSLVAGRISSSGWCRHYEKEAT